MSLQHVAELKQEVKKSQENAIQIEQKYKQQIIELGLKRDEEKQKLVREHENQVRGLCLPIFTFFNKIKIRKCSPLSSASSLSEQLMLLAVLSF